MPTGTLERAGAADASHRASRLCPGEAFLLHNILGLRFAVGDAAFKLMCKMHWQLQSGVQTWKWKS